MEEEFEPTEKVHMGRNIAKFRRFRGIKQYALAEKLNISQQSLSVYEGKEVVKPEILQQIAVILNVPAEILQSLPDESSSVVIENNTFQEGSVGNIAPYGQHEVKNENFGNTYNPTDDIIKVLKDIFVANENTINKLGNIIDQLQKENNK